MSTEWGNSRGIGQGPVKILPHYPKRTKTCSGSAVTFIAVLVLFTGACLAAALLGKYRPHLFQSTYNAETVTLSTSIGFLGGCIGMVAWCLDRADTWCRNCRNGS